LASRFETAGQIKPRFDAVLARIAADTGATLHTADIKNVGRAVEKIANDYNGNASRIKDLVRATMVVADTAQLQQVLQRVQALGWRVKRDNLSSDRRVPPEGYRDALVEADIDGFPAELQISTPKMMAAKAKAHGLYEEKQAIERKAAAEGRELTPEEDARVVALIEGQQAIYVPAWEATKARNSVASSMVPLRENESAGNRLPPGTSQAIAPPRVVYDTGMSSTSANHVPSGNDSGNSITGMGQPPDGIIPLAARAGDDLETRAGLALLEEKGDLTVPVELEDGRIVTAEEALRETDAELTTVNKNTLDVAVACGLRRGQ